MRVAKSIELTDDERDRLMRIAHAERSEVRLARRAGIVLLCADERGLRGLGSSLAFCLLHLLSPRHNAPDAENRQASKIAPGNWTRGR